jgi:hypothetical protein
VLEPVVVGFVTVCTCRIIASQKPSATQHVCANQILISHSFRNPDRAVDLGQKIMQPDSSQLD